MLKLKRVELLGRRTVLETIFADHQAELGLAYSKTFDAQRLKLSIAALNLGIALLSSLVGEVER